MQSHCSADGTHALTYELAWRHLHDPTRRASPQVRKQLGHNLKSSLQYVYRWVTLDDPYYPTEGFGLRCVQTALLTDISLKSSSLHCPDLTPSLNVSTRESRSLQVPVRKGGQECCAGLSQVTGLVPLLSREVSGGWWRLCRSSTEVAGLGWDANLLRFVRQQLQAQWCCALGSGVVFSLTGGLGATLPWGEGWRSRSTCISDRSAAAP